MATPNDAIPTSENASSWHGSPPDADETPRNDAAAEPRVLAPIVEQPPALRVRPYALSDIPGLIRFPGALRLDIPDSLVQPRPPFLELQAALPLLRRDRPMYVATADGQAVGFVRFSPRSPDGRWVLTAIAASTGVYAPEPVWDALLAHGVRSAGLRGVRRLFARVPVGHPLIESMRANGWVPYARETVFRAERAASLSRSHRDLRRQDPADTWAIHQLYATSVPRQVQEIEALTSHVWHMTHARRSRRGPRETGWLLEEGGQLAAYARYRRGPRAGMIDVVIAPGERERFSTLLDGVTGAPGWGRDRPVYCALRSYLLDMRDDLIERGFVALGEQELLIRYTTATARKAAPEAVHFPVELRPAMPRRVPTFLEGQPRDGTI